MKYYFPILPPTPIPIAEFGDHGCFWEDRGDRRHCGVDFYSVAGTEVFAVESGVVYDIGVFTSPKERNYWNETYYVLLKLDSGDYGLKYAELQSINVEKGDVVQSGDKLGTVGTVLIPSLIGTDAPIYVQELKQMNCPSMLHLEMHRFPHEPIQNYSGGNYFGNIIPDGLMNIEKYLLEKF